VRAFAALGEEGFIPWFTYWRSVTVTGCQARSVPARNLDPLTITSLTRGIGHIASSRIYHGYDIPWQIGGRSAHEKCPDKRS